MNTNYQFPLRLDRNLADQLDSVSHETGITKTAIARFSIEKFLQEFTQSGVRQAFHAIKQPNQTW